MMRLSRSLRKYRWLVFAGWLLALVPAVYLALTQSGNLTGGGFDVAGSQSLAVHDQLEDLYHDQGGSSLALVAAPRADASYQDMNDAVAQLRRIAAEVPGTTEIPNPTQRPPQPDRPYVLSVRLDSRNTSDVAKQLRTKVGIKGDQPGQTANGRVRLYVIGQGALSAAAAANTKHDIAAAEKWNLPVILIVLLAVFGSLAAAAIPLALGICTVVVTMGLVYLLSAYTTMSVFVTSTVSMFGIALAVDYSLFILMRFREELRSGRQPRDAVDAAMATSGLAVVLSGMTVIASLTGIYVINTPALKSMATGAILAVAVAMLTSTTLTPAALATFGRAAAKRSALLHWSRRPESTQSKFWNRWIGWVMRRPWMSALAASLVLLVMAAPAASMVLGNSLLRQFDSSHEIRAGVGAAAQALGPGALGPIRVLINFPDGGAASPEHSHTVGAVRQRMAQAPNIVSVSPPQFAEDNGSALLSAVLSVDPEDMKARETVGWMRAELPKVPEAGTARVDVGGPTALIKDFDDRVSATEPLVLGFVALIAFVMLLVSIHSVFLALKGVLMTLLSVAAAYGSLVMVFQWGWLRDLGFAQISSIDSTVPPLVLAMTFGLSMDYEIFLLTRIRERFLHSGNTRDAVAYGVSTSARTITSAALIMIAVFVGFAFAGMPLVAEIGVACAVAIAVDATVVRLVMVPALMAMFAQWNWWLPPWLSRVLPSVDFDRPLPEVDLGDVVVIPDDISALTAPSADLRMVLKSAAKLKHLAPDAICVTDPLAFTGCGRTTAAGADPARGLGPGQIPHQVALREEKVGVAAGPGEKTGSNGHTNGSAGAKKPAARNGRNGIAKAIAGTDRPVHPVTLWRGRLSVALDALQTDPDSGADRPRFRRRSPVETTNVQLPTGDRLLVPTGAETLRLKGYLLMCRNSRRDYADFADMVDALEPETAAVVLAGMDRYYCCESSRRQWIATQLVRRLADPDPCDYPDDQGPDADAPADWEQIRQRCLAVAVAMLEEAR
ncbi:MULTISPECIES: MMPL family transporter [Mycobacterium avium complex (MAC)]|uniref:MMPL family transporter n=1 Tax=Mycobacterium avium subsp. hominissuis TaxID=439334 RepID=A0A2U2DZG5_MYCAV|nr:MULTISPECIES: MMPL family transporter [Mycobacterium avium complex (MAC)]AXO21417.1 MMPL family transporter [Mycobacterium avium subsp. hominissuis]ETZ59081.1 MMPL family protein [Mycobacterium sp. MAC_080597_8934]ETZ68830.1 MMPL family protein [Mycobacterium sp. MAC_011194_8550]MCA4731250.1 MMPL family transporter [Mycobacterium avium subsp. hominissuis]MDO2360635.1 MMPL family transporter [Mycobacterium avium subsp. hominissuis]